MHIKVHHLPHTSLCSVHCAIGVLSSLSSKHYSMKYLYFILILTNWYEYKKPKLKGNLGKKFSLPLYLSDYRFVTLSEDRYTNKLQWSRQRCKVTVTKTESTPGLLPCLLCRTKEARQYQF